VRALWSERIIGARALGELTRWTPGASFPPGHRLRYQHYGLGMGTNTVEGVELIGHTGFIGAFAFHAPRYDAVLTGTHNASQVDRWPLVAALCRELRELPRSRSPMTNRWGDQAQAGRPGARAQPPAPARIPPHRE
jgi:hypothetical protein